MQKCSLPPFPRLMPRLHVPFNITIFPFKNGFNAVPWCCLHVTLKRSNMPLKTVALTARVNEV